MQLTANALPELSAVAVGDLVVRIALFAFGGLMLHNAICWKNTWFFGTSIAPGWKRQSEMAQSLLRIFLVMFGSMVIVAAMFGTIVRR